MGSLLARFGPLLLDLPVQGKLAYCLFRDRRVPLRSKAVLVGALALLLGPIDLPDWVPLGHMEAIPLVLIAMRVFNDTAPREVVQEQRAELLEQRSVFERDWRTVANAVRRGLDAALTVLRRPAQAEPEGE